MNQQMKGLWFCLFQGQRHSTQHLKLPFAMLASCNRVSVWDLDTQLQAQLRANAPKKAAADGPSIWAPVTHAELEAPSFHLA